jgi:hypothetical protein
MLQYCALAVKAGCVVPSMYCVPSLLMIQAWRCCWCSADVALAAVQADLPELRRRLTSASRRSRALANKQLQLLYHTRQEAEAGENLEVPCSAYVAPMQFMI